MRKKRVQPKEDKDKADILKQLAEDVLWPTLKALKGQVVTYEGGIIGLLGDFFAVDDREIYIARLKAPINQLPGYLWLSDGTLSESLGKRTVSKQAIIALRVDVTETDKLDIEVAEPGEEERTFTLTKSDWSCIKEKVEIILYSGKVILEGNSNADKIREYHDSFIKEHLGCSSINEPRAILNSDRRFRNKLSR